MRLFDDNNNIKCLSAYTRCGECIKIVKCNQAAAACVLAVCEYAQAVSTSHIQ